MTLKSFIDFNLFWQNPLHFSLLFFIIIYFTRKFGKICMLFLEKNPCIVYCSILWFLLKYNLQLSCHLNTSDKVLTHFSENINSINLLSNASMFTICSIDGITYVDFFNVNSISFVKRTHNLFTLEISKMHCLN